MCSAICDFVSKRLMFQGFKAHEAASKTTKKPLTRRDDGTYRRRQQPHGWYDRRGCGCHRRGL